MHDCCLQSPYNRPVTSSAGAIRPSALLTQARRDYGSAPVGLPVSKAVERLSREQPQGAWRSSPQESQQGPESHSSKDSLLGIHGRNGQAMPGDVAHR